MLQNTLPAPVVRPLPTGPAGRLRPIGQSVIPFPANEDAADRNIWFDGRFARQRSVRDQTTRDRLEQRAHTGNRFGTETTRANSAVGIDAAAFDVSHRRPAYNRPIAPFLAQHIAQSQVSYANDGANSYANASAAYRQTFDLNRTILGPQVYVSYRL